MTRFHSTIADAVPLALIFKRFSRCGGMLFLGGLFAAVAWSALPFSVARGQADGNWGPTFSVSDGHLKIPGVGSDNPVIYDNDWWLDIIDASFCAAQHKLGKLDLRGFIVTRDMWRNPPDQYSLEDGVDDFNRFRELALQSGLHTVPKHVAGAAERLVRPDSGKISDTPFTGSDGSELIIQEALAATPDKPLVIVVGGAPTTVATALLEKPEIAERLVVLWLAIRQYNSNDQWASWVMLQRAAVVHYDFQLRNGLSRDMLDSLPENPLCERFKSSDLVLDNGVGDGVLLTWLFDYEVIRGAEKQNVQQGLDYAPTSESPYGFLHIPNQFKRPKAIARIMVNALRDPRIWNSDFDHAVE